MVIARGWEKGEIRWCWEFIRLYELLEDIGIESVWDWEFVKWSPFLFSPPFQCYPHVLRWWRWWWWVRRRNCIALYSTLCSSRKLPTIMSSAAPCKDLRLLLEFRNTGCSYRQQFRSSLRQVTYEAFWLYACFNQDTGSVQIGKEKDKESIHSSEPTATPAKLMTFSFNLFIICLPENHFYST